MEFDTATEDCTPTTILGVSEKSCHLFVRAGVGFKWVRQDIIAKPAVAGNLRPCPQNVTSAATKRWYGKHNPTTNRSTT